MEVTTTETNEVMNPANLDAWGENEMSSQDLIIPKLLMMQPGSKMVVDGKATFGEFRNSVTGAKMGDLKNPVTVIPFAMEKTWIISTKTAKGGQYEYETTMRVTAQNEEMKWEEMVDGVMVKREKIHSFYCLTPDNLRTPIILSIRGTSARTAKKIATQMYVDNAEAGLAPAATMMKITGSKSSNDKGTFVVLDTEPAGKTPAKAFAKAFDWYKIIKQGLTKVDDSDINNTPNEETRF